MPEKEKCKSPFRSKGEKTMRPMFVFSLSLVSWAGGTQAPNAIR